MEIEFTEDLKELYAHTEKGTYLVHLLEKKDLYALEGPVKTKDTKA